MGMGRKGSTGGDRVKAGAPVAERRGWDGKGSDGKGRERIGRGSSEHKTERQPNEPERNTNSNC